MLSSQDMVRSKMTDLQIRGVPVALRDRLRRRAQRKGVSMSHYVTEMLQSELATPSVDEWLEEVAALPKADLRGADVGKLVRELDEQRAEEVVRRTSFSTRRSRSRSSRAT